VAHNVELSESAVQELGKLDVQQVGNVPSGTCEEIDLKRKRPECSGKAARFAAILSPVFISF
jgi:hypothetical protein